MAISYNELKNIIESIGFCIENFDESLTIEQDLYIFVPDADFKSIGGFYPNPIAYKVIATASFSNQQELFEMTVYYRILVDKNKKLYLDGISYKLGYKDLTENKLKKLFEIFKKRIKNKKIELKMSKIERDF